MRDLPPNFHAHEHGSGRQPPGWMLVPAYTVLPLLRRPLGYKIVWPLSALGPIVILTVVPLVFWAFYMAVTHKEPPEPLGHWRLIGFLGVCFAVQCYVFAQRAVGQRRGEEVHQHEAGWSFLTWRTQLPAPVCEQFLVPAALGLAGYFVKDAYSFELGWWLILCSLSYALMSVWEHMRRLAQARAPVDDIIRAKVFEQRFTAHERKARSAGRTGGQGATGTQRPSSAGYSDEPDVAELGSKTRGRRPTPPPEDEDAAYRPAEPPDAVGWRRGNDGPVPDYMTWFRRKGGR